ncbi:MAG TPA: alpha/beta fold hydrolase [Pyrinomonadaceae bacterium]|jgi:predicted alpha/beta hydrolase|nr:alpha/beta fold hydrolase [Pyrinomonadaceae bacterium]
MSKRAQDIRIPATDGFELAASLYEPPDATASAPLVIVNSGTGIKRGYYGSFAAFLAEQGCPVVTYDYRGIGDSGPVKLSGFRAHMREWGEKDLAGVIEWASGRFPGRALAAVGHSAGGQIVGLADNNSKLGALLFVAAQSGYWRLWPSPSRYRLSLIWFVAVPVLTGVFGYLPGWAGTGASLPAGVAREWAEWCRREGYLVGGANSARRAGFSRLRVPILSYSLADDTYAPRVAVESLLELYTGGAKTLRHVEPAEVSAKTIGHFGFFKSRFRNTLWREAAEWLLSQGRAGQPAT